MRTAIFGLAIFLAGIAPGLIQHGQPLPNSGRKIAQPVQANTVASKAESPLMALLVRFRPTERS